MRRLGLEWQLTCLWFRCVPEREAWPIDPNKEDGLWSSTVHAIGHILSVSAIVATIGVAAYALNLALHYWQAHDMPIVLQWLFILVEHALVVVDVLLVGLKLFVVVKKAWKESLE